MKNLVANSEWEHGLEYMLAEMQIPYRVSFDNHDGQIRKIITIEEFSIFPYHIE